MKVLHVSPSFFPATSWGGPIWSTKAICDGIARRAEFDLRVITTDAGGPNVADRIIPAGLSYPVQHSRRQAGHSISAGLLARLPAAIAWADIVHLTGTYSFPTLPTLGLSKLIGRPLVWSPRGALQATAEWQGAPNKRIKRGFAKLAQALRPNDCVLHVTSASEKMHSQSSMPGIASRLITNCVSIPPMIDRKPRGSILRLLYMGRLHPKKGIEALIEAMAKLPPEVELDICGTGDPHYVHKLNRQAIEFGSRIRMRGHLEGRAKEEAFAKADLFVLPSHSENFAISVAEALAHGVPVLASQATPWQRLDDMRAGRCIDLGQTDLADEIKRLAKADLVWMGQNGRVWMERDFSARAMTDEFAELYGSLISARPEGVPA